MVRDFEQNENEHVIIDKGYLYDKRPSLEDKGVMSVISCCFAHKEFSIDELGLFIKEGPDVVVQSIERLMKCGYVSPGSETNRVLVRGE